MAGGPRRIRRASATSHIGLQEPSRTIACIIFKHLQLFPGANTSRAKPIGSAFIHSISNLPTPRLFHIASPFLFLFFSSHFLNFHLIEVSWCHVSFGSVVGGAEVGLLIFASRSCPIPFRQHHRHHHTLVFSFPYPPPAQYHPQQQP